MWLVEGQQPTATDMLGASIAIIGARHRWLGRSDVIACFVFGAAAVSLRLSLRRGKTASSKPTPANSRDL
jgi:hypothetical protein